MESLPGKFEVLSQDTEKVGDLFKLVERTLTDPALASKITDPVEAAMLEAMLPELFEGGHLRPHIDEIFAMRRSRQSYYPPGYALRTLEFGIDKQVRRKFPDYYPVYFSAAGTWQHFKVFEELDYVELFTDAQENLRSTDVDSYQAEKILSNLLAERWQRPPVAVDSGMGFGVGLKKWAMYDTYPYDPIQILKAPRRGEPISPDLAPDEEMQAKVNHLVQQKPVISKLIGYDILPISSEDKGRVDIGFSSTFPMSRSTLDPKGVKEFYSLLSESPPEVTLLKQELFDATDPRDLANLAQYLPGGKADIFTFSGILMQLPPEKLVNFFHNFVPYCKDGALFFVKEWANLSPKQPSGLKMINEDWWHKGHFKLFIIDPFNLDKPPMEFCRFLNRQCEQMYLTPDGQRLMNDHLP
jgi:hypothetical protein